LAELRFDLLGTGKNLAQIGAVAQFALGLFESFAVKAQFGPGEDCILVNRLMMFLAEPSNVQRFVVIVVVSFAPWIRANLTGLLY
jgi:hypothetical protein